jgi:hypothetical protein
MRSTVAFLPFIKDYKQNRKDYKQNRGASEPKSIKLRSVI